MNKRGLSSNDGQIALLGWKNKKLVFVFLLSALCLTTCYYRHSKKRDLDSGAYNIVPKKGMKIFNQKFTCLIHIFIYLYIYYKRDCHKNKRNKRFLSFVGRGCCTPQVIYGGLKFTLDIGVPAVYIINITTTHS